MTADDDELQFIVDKLTATSSSHEQVMPHKLCFASKLSQQKLLVSRFGASSDPTCLVAPTGPPTRLAVVCSAGERMYKVCTGISALTSQVTLVVTVGERYGIHLCLRKREIECREEFFCSSICQWIGAHW